MMRDVVGIFGLYFIPVERRGNEEFLIGDCYPAVFQGEAKDGILKLNLYSVFPISPTRALFLTANGVEAAPLGVSGFPKGFFKKPKLSRDRKTLTFRFQKIYEQDVKMINDTMFENAIEGVAFRDSKMIHNVK
jgi:hypothetical protein